MDNHPQDLSPGGGRPPRKELQGPKPTPLKVRKEPFKVKKPPVAPPLHHHHQPPQQPPPPRQPVIIYTVSPKVIHANPSEFMTVVQQLTGPDPTSSSTSSSSSFPFRGGRHGVVVGGGISPAARFASIERTKMPRESKKVGGSSGGMEGEIMEISGGDGGFEGVEKTGFSPAGILSPGPGSLPPISPNLFSPLFHHDPISHINLHHNNELSGVQHQAWTRNFMEGSNSSPSLFFTNNLISPSPITMLSPSSLDLLRHILDN